MFFFHFIESLVIKIIFTMKKVHVFGKLPLKPPHYKKLKPVNVWKIFIINIFYHHCHLCYVVFQKIILPLYGVKGRAGRKIILFPEGFQKRNAVSDKSFFFFWKHKHSEILVQPSRVYWFGMLPLATKTQTGTHVWNLNACIWNLDMLCHCKVL